MKNGAETRTVITRSPPRAQIAGRPVEHLTPLELELLCYLHERRGQVCTKDEIVEHVYRQQHGRLAGSMDDARLQALVSRLRARIAQAVPGSEIVVTVRGEGYKFVEPEGAGGTAPMLSASERIPYREHILREYVGDRHRPYARLLESRNVVGIWGAPGVGKTWVGARLALEWEAAGPPPPAAPRPPAGWFECREGMGFYDLAYGLAGFLYHQGDPWLWQMLQQDPLPNPVHVIDHLVNRLAGRPYLLCFDDAHHVDGVPHAGLLFEALERQGGRAGARVLLVGRQRPAVRGIAARELRRMPVELIREIVLRQRGYEKEWLDEAGAGDIARRLVALVGANLPLLNAVALDWFRSNTSPDEAAAYLEALDRAQIARLVWERETPPETHLLAVLAVLESWEEESVVFDLVRAAEGPAGGAGLDAALAALREARLVEGDGDRYRLHESVRAVCREKLAEQPGRLAALHRGAGDYFLAAGRQSAGGSASLLKAARHFLHAGDYGQVVQVLGDTALDLILAGQGEAARSVLEELARQLAGREDCLDRRQWLWVYIVRGDLNAWLGDLPAAQGAAELGLEELGDDEYPYEKARLQARLGAILGKMHRLDDAIPLLAASRAALAASIPAADSAAERARRRVALLHVLDSLALACYVRGDYGEAGGFLEELRRYAQALGGDPRAAFFAARALVRLGQVHDDAGDLARAEEEAAAGRREFAALQHPWGLSFAGAELGRIGFKRGDYGRARAWYEESLSIARELYDRELMVNCHLVLGEIGLVDRDCRDLAGAAGHLEAARRLMAGRPEQARPEEESAAPVRLPPPLEGFFEACRLWMQGLERLPADPAGGRACLEGARQLLEQWGFQEDAGLVGTA